MDEIEQARAWPVFTYAGFQEDLQLRPYGILRHVVNKQASSELHYEYESDQYCVDGVKLLGAGSHFSHSGPDLHKSDPNSIYYALICEPVGPWDQVDFFNVFVRIFYPIGLGLGLVALVGLVSLHFILKELRDLSGCMLISLVVSLIVSMLANLILVTTDSQSNSYIDLLYLGTLISFLHHRAHSIKLYLKSDYDNMDHCLCQSSDHSEFQNIFLD